MGNPIFLEEDILTFKYVTKMHSNLVLTELVGIVLVKYQKNNSTYFIDENSDAMADYSFDSFSDFLLYYAQI
jgi:hypothetical protein